MLIKARSFHYCWCCSCVSSFLLVSTHTVPPTLTMHTLAPTHTNWLPHMHTCRRPFHLRPNCTDPNLPMLLGARSHTPLSSPSLSRNLPCTLPTAPTFIPAHKQAPTCLPLHSSPSTHRHIYFCSHFLELKHAHIPMHAHSLAHTLTRALPFSLFLDHKACAHTPKQPQCMPQSLN